ncbi:retrograde regulation protein 2 [Talaromyces stipitatus ATCC 10500]|uniref:Retrograde regulation protein 2 n=1 Tax=Talaromyces stipitatus (strain ATCC 10500 / CBS 375.48 / QM 6759 / NRRL 1006) TaxID=441959 RepID=B8M1K2_TALSN|nr:retrograde regulation protein 2 [Talaromyces stipitatus ATCC 10500]EED22089.1 retrograde regulation protein 2 [Talaromyces stipitatus ATCC 10500]
MTSLRELKPECLYAVVDMGSNGIRFSISNLEAPTTRIMPTVFQDRAGISLYDAQFTTADGRRGPISASVIDDVISRLLRFKTTCEDFEVSAENIYVLATEATRTAPNSKEFIDTIKERTGWDVRMLSKSDEGRIGALGVASSFASVQGLVMDLGGGSTQLTWMVAKDGNVTTSPQGSISFPYGAAALTRRLQDTRNKGAGAERELIAEMKENFRNAYKDLQVPGSLEHAATAQGGFDLYLSGGGFRGWGYLLMSQSRLDPYPIPIINGFEAVPADFQDTSSIMQTASTSEEKKIFRVSKRRASQVPAVALLVHVLTECLPTIRSVQFCQGGVREGFLFDMLEPNIRKQDPILIATIPYATSSAGAIYELLQSSVPETPSPIHSRHVPESFSPSLLRAISNLVFVHASVPRETRPAAGLYSTTTGILASANSLAHRDRAIIALVLSERWPGDLAPAEESFQRRLRQFVSSEEAWWSQYLGRVASLIGDVYPAGRVPARRPRIQFSTKWEQIFKKKQGTTDCLCLQVQFHEQTEQTITKEALLNTTNLIENCGKMKNWIKGDDRLGNYGVSTEVRLHS